MKGKFTDLTKKTRSIPAKTFKRLVNYGLQEIVIPLPYIKTKNSVKWLYSIRSPSEKILSNKESSFMERMRLDEKILARIQGRKGRKHETLVKACYRCFSHELGYRIKGFNNQIGKVFTPRAAFDYSYKQINRKQVRGIGLQTVVEKKRLYGIVFEQTRGIHYSWNENEVSEIRLTMSRKFRTILTSQVMQLVSPEPPGHRENLKWLIDKIVDLNFDFSPYSLSLRAVHRKSAKGVYPMPISSRTMHKHA